MYTLNIKLHCVINCILCILLKFHNIRIEVIICFVMSLLMITGCFMLRPKIYCSFRTIMPNLAFDINLELFYSINIFICP